MRLKGAVDATLAGIEPSANSAMALVKAYQTFYEAAHNLADRQQLASEFNLLFPEPEPPSSVSPTPTGTALFRNEAIASEAASTIYRLAGWLEGFLNLQLLNSEQDAYISARSGHED